MKVEYIDSKMPFKFCRPRVTDRVPEGMKFLAAAVLAFWAPTLLYCAVTGQALPFYLMVCNESLGVLMGLWLYEKHTDESLTCVPTKSKPAALSRPDDQAPKKAA